MMYQQDEATLSKALDGDIHAFQSLFSSFQQPLRSYLYRLTAHRNDADDLTHDTFIQAFDKLSTFRGEASLKTWVFTIATRLAYNHLRQRKRWTANVSQQAKALVLSHPHLQAQISTVHSTSPQAAYDIREHISTCFTCIGKNLPIENQVAVILKDIYDFSVADIGRILQKTEGVVKYLLQDGRKTMHTIFEQKCALINKKGACHQCSELNGWFNPLQDQQQALMQLDMVRTAHKYDRAALYKMRVALVKAIDPLNSPGSDLQDILLRCNRMAMQEEALPPH